MLTVNLSMKTVIGLGDREEVNINTLSGEDSRSPTAPSSVCLLVCTRFDQLKRMFHLRRLKNTPT